MAVFKTSHSDIFSGTSDVCTAFTNIPAPGTLDQTYNSDSVDSAFKNYAEAEKADSQALSHFSKMINVPDYIPFRFARTCQIYRINPKKERIETLQLKSTEEFNRDLNNPNLKESHKTTFKWVAVTSILTAYNITFNPQRVHKNINLTEDMYADFVRWVRQFIKVCKKNGEVVEEREKEEGEEVNLLELSLFRPAHKTVQTGEGVKEEIDMPLYIKMGAFSQEYYESSKSSGQYQMANQFAAFVRHGETWNMKTIRAYLDWRHQAEYNGWPTE